MRGSWERPNRQDGGSPRYSIDLAAVESRSRRVIVRVDAEGVRGDVVLVDGRVGNKVQIENPRLGPTHFGAV
jgi:hypothetical protein